MELDCSVEGCLTQFSWRTEKLTRLPLVLAITLGRFRDDGTKIGTDVSFPLEDLDLSPFVRIPENHSQVKYDLCSAIVHQGSIQHSGHYIAHVRGQGRWWRCNDTTVTEISAEVAHDKQSYILVYQQQNATANRNIPVNRTDKENVATQPDAFRQPPSSLGHGQSYSDVTRSPSNSSMSPSPSPSPNRSYSNSLQSTIKKTRGALSSSTNTATAKAGLSVTQERAKSSHTKTKKRQPAARVQASSVAQASVSKNRSPVRKKSKSQSVAQDRAKPSQTKRQPAASAHSSVSNRSPVRKKSKSQSVTQDRAKPSQTKKQQPAASAHSSVLNRSPVRKKSKSQSVTQDRAKPSQTKRQPAASAALLSLTNTQIDSMSKTTLRGWLSAIGVTKRVWDKFDENELRARLRSERASVRKTAKGYFSGWKKK